MTYLCIKIDKTEPAPQHNDRRRIHCKRRFRMERAGLEAVPRLLYRGHSAESGKPRQRKKGNGDADNPLLQQGHAQSIAPPHTRTCRSPVTRTITDNYHTHTHTMARFKGIIEVDTKRCKGCNLCVVSCPLKLIELSPMVNHNGYNYAVQTDPEKCNGCSSCGIICPDGCITVYRTKE